MGHFDAALGHESPRLDLVTTKPFGSPVHLVRSSPFEKLLLLYFLNSQMHTDQLRVVKQWNTVKHMRWVAFSARCEKWCRTPPVSEEGRAGDGWFERCSTGYDVTALAQVTIKCFFRTYPCLMTKAVLIRSTLSAGQENLDSCWLIMVPRSRRLQVVRVVHTIRSKGAPRVACGKVSCNCSMLLAVNVHQRQELDPKSGFTS